MTRTWPLTGDFEDPVLREIRGFVRSSADGRPLAGVRVLDIDSPSNEYYAWHPSPEDDEWTRKAACARSESDGSYRLVVRGRASSLPRKVLLSLEGFYPWGRVYEPGREILVFDVALRPCGVLRGVVRTPRGRPLEGASLTLMASELQLRLPTQEEDQASSRLGRPEVLEAVSDATGRFSLWPVACGKDYVLCAGPQVNTGWTHQYGVRISEEAPHEVPDLVLEPAYTVIAEVHGVDHRAREIRVRLLGEDGTEVACESHEGVPQPYDPEVFGADWGFTDTFRGLAPGNYRVEVLVDGTPSRESPVAARVSETAATVVRVSAATG